LGSCPTSASRAAFPTVEYLDEREIVQDHQVPASVEYRLSRSSETSVHNIEDWFHTICHIDGSTRRDISHPREARVYSDVPQRKLLQLKGKEKQQKLKKNKSNKYPSDASNQSFDKVDVPHLMKLARKVAAEETMQVLTLGWYTSEESSLGADGQSISKTSSVVDINEQIKQAIQNAVCYPPEDDIGNIATVSTDSLMVVEVVDDTTLNCCRRIWEEVSVIFIR
jgi:hypothetical protein